MSVTKSICLGAMTLIWMLGSAEAQNNPMFKITVEKQQKTERDVKQKGSAKDSGSITTYKPQVTDRNQAVVMNIKIQNTGTTELKGLIVKYAVLGKDIKGKNTEVAAKGEQKIDLKPLQSQTVQTDPAKFQIMESKFVQGEFTELNQQAGKKYYGVAIAIYNGTAKVATYYEPSSVQKEIGTLSADF